jgi:hypothetical protein
MGVVTLIVVLFAGLIVFGIWMVRWQYRKAETRLREWAQQHHYQILETESANPIGTGPMARSGNKQVMFRVTLSDGSGVRRRALVKVGSESIGVLGGDVVVEWEPSRE